MCTEKKTKKSMNDGFMYVCVAEKCEMMDFYFVFSIVVFIDNFPPSLGKKNPKNDGFLCMNVCVKQNPSLMDFFLFFFPCTLPL